MVSVENSVGLWYYSAVTSQVQLTQLIRKMHVAYTRWIQEQFHALPPLLFLLSLLSSLPGEPWD